MRASRCLLLASIVAFLGPGTLPAQVDAPLPTLTAAVPNRFAQGSVGSSLRLLGTNLPPGLTIYESGKPQSAITFTRVRTLSPTAAQTTVTVPRDVPPGVYTFTVIADDIPDIQVGARPVGTFSLRVAAASSLVAPLSVTTLAVVHPQQGTQVARGERLHPRALLAVTGSGTVTGFWELDGVPFDRFVVQVRGGRPAPVNARVPVPILGAGTHRLSARIDTPQTLRSTPVELVFTAPRPPLMRLLSPAPNELLADAAPTFRWTLQPGAFGYEVLISEGAALRPSDARVFKVREPPWQLPDAAALASGVHTWTVRPVFAGGVVGREVEGQSFELGTGSGVTAVRAAFQDTTEEAATEEALPFLDTQLDADTSFTWIDGDAPGEEEQARLALSGSAYRERPGHRFNGSADVSFLQELDGEERLIQESRSYVLTGARERGPWGVLGSLGYFGPAGVANSSFLASGLARGGAEIGLQSPAGLVQVYGTYDDSASGVTSGSLGAEQEVLIGGWALPFPAERGSLQLMALDVEDPGSTEFLIPAARGTSYGLAGSFTRSTWTLGFEAADSEVEEEGADAVGGQAFRIDAGGRAAGSDLYFSYQQTDSGFANPASGTLVAGGIPDRRDASLSLSRLFGETSLSLSTNFGQSGADEDAGVGRARQVGFQASVTTPLRPTVTLSLDGNWTRDRSDATPLTPVFEISNAGANASLFLTRGAFSFSQTLGIQTTRNGGPPEAADADIDIWTVALSSDGALKAGWTLSSSASWTRIEPALGDRADTTLLSVQPGWSYQGWSVTPWISVTWSDLPPLGTQRLTQANLTTSWNPAPRGRHSFGLSFAAGWSETRDPALPPDPASTFTDTTASLTLNWRWSHSSAAARAARSNATIAQFRLRPGAVAPGGAHFGLPGVRAVP